MQYKSRIQVKCIYLPCLNYYVLPQFLERRNRHSFHILWHEENVALKEKSKTNWFLKDNSISTRPRLLAWLTDMAHLQAGENSNTPTRSRSLNMGVLKLQGTHSLSCQLMDCEKPRGTELQQRSLFQQIYSLTSLTREENFLHRE